MSESPRPPTKHLRVSAKISIALSEIEFTFARSSGAGGQNVNRTNSKAVLRWHPASSSSLPEGVRFRLLEKLASRLTGEGDLLIVSDRFRDRDRNEADCLAKLATIIQSVELAPKVRRATRPTKGSKVRRLKAKKANSEKKRQRSAKEDW